MEEQFLFKMHHDYVPKNNLDAQISKLLKSHDATLITGKQALKDFKALLKANIDQLHLENPRCNAIKLDIWSFSGRDQAVRCGCSNGQIYTVKKQYPTKA